MKTRKWKVTGYTKDKQKHFVYVISFTKMAAISKAKNLLQEKSGNSAVFTHYIAEETK